MKEGAQAAARGTKLLMAKSTEVLRQGVSGRELLPQAAISRLCKYLRRHLFFPESIWYRQCSEGTLKLSPSPGVVVASSPRSQKLVITPRLPIHFRLIQFEECRLSINTPGAISQKSGPFEAERLLCDAIWCGPVLWNCPNRKNFPARVSLP